MRRRVVVTGIGIVSALGANFTEFWNRLTAGESGVKRITGFDVSDLSTQTGAEITDFDVDGCFSPKESRRLSLISKLAIIAAQQAVDASNLSQQDVERAGIFVGCSQGGFIEAEYGLRSVLTHRKKVSPFTLIKGMNSAPASAISIRLQLHGPSITFDTACSSASHAIGNAARYIRNGDLDVMLAGGVDSVFSPYLYELWCSLRALSKRNEVPAAACRPFDVTRDGTVLGEGSAFLMLESDESALKRDARIYGEILGYGFSSDAHDFTQPDVTGQIKAMRLAIADACVKPTDIGYVSAHGTGTQWNDPIEAQAIQTVFESARPLVSGTKGATGHTLAAAGALNAVVCLGAIDSGIVPKTLNLENPIDDFDLDYVRCRNRERDVPVCMSNTFAFGGSNAVLVVGRHGEETYDPK